MKWIKNIFKILLFLIVLFLIAVIAIPIFMKDEIVQVIKEETNSALNAKVDFRDAELSLLRNFPSISLSIDNFTVDGIDEFEGIRLFGAPAAELELDFWKVLTDRASIPVKAFTLESPTLNIRVLKNGKANWDIAKSAPSTDEEPIRYLVEMEAYSVKNGHITYMDESLDFEMNIENLNHLGSGDFSESIFDLDTESTIETVSAKMDGITYLREAKANLDAIINMDINELIFTLKDNVLTLNELQVKTDGMVDMNDEDIIMDLRFSSPQNDFRNLWSIIPSAYTTDYAQAKIDGKMSFSGLVAGTYNGEKEIYPAFKISTQIDNGNIQYPDLPLAIKAIFADVTVNSPSSDFDDLVLRIPQFEFKLGDNPFTGNFNLRNPISNPTLKTAVRGTLNLADVSRAIPLEEVEELNGVIKSDFYINGTMSQMEQARYDQMDMRGNMSATNLVVAQKGQPKVTIQTLQTDISPQRIKVDDFVAQLGQSDVSASGRIDNLLAYFSPEKTMNGQFRFRSDYINANEWVSEVVAEDAVGMSQSIDAPKALLVSNEAPSEAFDRFNFNIDGQIKQLDYDIYQLSDMQIDGTINPNQTHIDRFYTKIGDSDIQTAGRINNLLGYALDNEVLTGDLDIKSDYLDLNQFMVETTEKSEAEAPLEVIPVPENIDITINSNLKKVRYTNFNLTDIRGAILVKESAAIMKGVKGKLLGGDVTFEGGYDTKDLSKPAFSIDATLNSMNFSNAFSTFNTFERLAPIGKFIEGKFNTTLKMNGILGKDMIPDLSTLNLSGFFHTLEGVISGFKPLSDLGSKLNIEDKVKTVKIKDSKNWIEVQDGFLSVKEFDYTIDDISMKIGGRHSLTQQMDYVIKALVPREYLEKTGLTAAVNNAWSAISKEAAKKGISLADGENIRLKIDLTGTMTAPKFSIIPVAADGETSVQDATKAAIESTVAEAKDSLETVVNQTTEKVKEEANALKDSVTSVVEEKTETIKNQAEETAKSALDSLVSGGKVGLPKLDSIGSIIKDTTIGKEVNKAKDKLKDLLPFGKKKKKDGGE